MNLLSDCYELHLQYEEAIRGKTDKEVGEIREKYLNKLNYILHH
nr:hypothetical protein [Candidatus Gracilibacteria bacterium]